MGYAYMLISAPEENRDMRVKGPERIAQQETGKGKHRLGTPGYKVCRELVYVVHTRCPSRANLATE